MILRYSVFLIVLFFIYSCSTEKPKDTSDKFLKVEGQNFVDPEGREVVLSGINFISKDPLEKYMPKQGEETFKQFKAWGFNCIRLGIIWDGLEPEPGKYNEAYLQEIDKRIKWAEKNDVYVFLDMHQDLFSAKFSDGAPEWATITGDQPHYKGDVWSDSYLISPAVQTAFDNFWNNAPAKDGIGLQDHYANLWKLIAERYAKNPTVIGYDVMNEPFMGSEAQNVLPMMLGAYAQVYVEVTGEAPPSANELAAMWGSEASRMEALNMISTRDRYSKVVDAVYEVSAAFEKNQLQPFYQKVADAIREVDMNHILIYNHNYFVNTGVSTALEATKLPDGTRDPQVAYGAHGYDLVVDTKENENQSRDRVEFIFDRVAESGKRMNMPVLLGEWGALHSKSEKMVETAQHLVGIIETHKFSNTFWAYYGDIDQYPFFQKAIVRPYPQRISGKLDLYDYNFESGEFTFVWEESGNEQEPSVIYVPVMANLTEEDIATSPAADQIVFEHCTTSGGGWLLVSPLGKPMKRTLNFKMHLTSGDEFTISKN